MDAAELRQLIIQASRGKLARLNLRDLHLTELPPEIGLLDHLQRLFLGGNQLTVLPPEIAIARPTCECLT